MKTNSPRNLSASVRDRLLMLARQGNEDFQNVLTRYANERLLYRISQSPFCQNFTLKGATLFTCWTGDAHRPTRDLDLLGFGVSDVADVVGIFIAICGQDVEEDGLVFMPDTVTGAIIKEGEEYEGVRISFWATLGTAKISVQVDIGYGDAVTPSAQRTVLPTLLKMPSAELLTYPRETVIAEKCQAMVKLGMVNSRVKDFYDLWYLATHFDFEGFLLVQAVMATFKRRETAIPSQIPTGLTPIYYNDPARKALWRAFSRRSSRPDNHIPAFEEAVSILTSFLMPLFTAIHSETEFAQRWQHNILSWQTGKQTDDTGADLVPADGE